MGDDLVKRLENVRCDGVEELCWEAADRIEALQAERDALAAELRDVRMSELAALGQAQEAYEQQQALAAEVERLREALGKAHILARERRWPLVQLILDRAALEEGKDG